MRRLFCFLVLSVFLLSCTKNTPKPLKKQKETIEASLIGNAKVVQPLPSDKNIDYGALIGFWDFDKNGNNAIKRHSGNWNLDKSVYKDGYLDLKSYVRSHDDKDLYDLSVRLYDMAVGKYIGLHQRKYFSGAIKFKISRDKLNVQPLLTFGIINRFLEFYISSEGVSVCANGTNLKLSGNLKPVLDSWNILYFRYEDFTGNGITPSDGNHFYLQMNNRKECIVDFKDLHLDLVAPKHDIVLSFINQSVGEMFRGQVDWVIMSVGRMTPGNTQYKIQELK
ncbi:hypothetical protein E0494_01810 [Marinilabiliaceae bacterium JC040]|nr:hypothetical protein [Marinilabiliaceae bacterium JC040]